MTFVPLNNSKPNAPNSGFTPLDGSAVTQPSQLSSDLWMKLAAPKTPPKPDPLASVHIGGTNTTGKNSLTDALGLSSMTKFYADTAQNIFDPAGAEARGVPTYTAPQAIGAASQLSSIVNPIKGIGTAAISGAANLGGQALTENKDATTVAKQTAIGAATGGAIGLAGKAASALGQGFYKYFIPRSTRESQLLQTYRANTPFLERVMTAAQGTSKAPRLTADTAFDKGLVGTEEALGVQGKRAAQNLWKDLISPALSRSKRTTDLEGFFARTAADIEATTPELTRQKSLLNALSAVADDYRGHKPITDLELQDLKKGWAAFVPQKHYKGEDIAGALNEVRAKLADQARQDIYSVVPTEVKQAYIDYGNLQGIQELGVDAMSGRVKGGSGTVLSGIRDMLMTPVATIGGETVYLAGKGIELTGPKGLSSVGELLDTMTASGQQQPLQATAQPQQSQSSITSQNASTDPFKDKFGVTQDEFKAKYGKYVEGSMGLGIGSTVKPAGAAAEALKDAVISKLQQGAKSLNGTLNEKAASEASDVLHALTTNPNVDHGAINYALEILRLQGHDVSSLADEFLKASQKEYAQLRDAIGRFTKKTPTK